MQNENRKKEGAATSNKVLKVPFKQTTQYGCGRYALANLFNTDSYLHVFEYADDWDKRYQVLSELNPCIHSEGLHLEYLFLTNKALPEGNRLTVRQSSILNPVDKFKVNLEAGSVVPLLVIYVNGNGNLHIAAMATHVHENICHLVDSAEDEIIIGAPEWFAANYWIVGVAVFTNYPIKNPNDIAVTNVTSLPHIYGE